MAGSSFLRARSPVTPKTTSAHGSGTRGSRRSLGSRSGLARSVTVPGGAAAGTSTSVCSPVAVSVSAGTVVTVLPGSVAVSSNGVQICPGSGRPRGVQLCLHTFEQLLPGVLELLHTFDLEHFHHVVVVDADS